MNFKEYLKENSTLVEGLGGLEGLPKAFVKQITRSSLAGEASKIELVKSNAKRKDLTAAIKMVGNHENEHTEESDLYSGVAFKIDGAWTYLGLLEKWEAGKMFLLLKPDGKFEEESETKFPTYSRRVKGHKPYTFQRSNITATELGDRFDFSGTNVEVYLITVDESRKAIQELRREARNTGADPVKRKALEKFLKSKNKGLIDDFKADLENQFERLKGYADRLVNHDKDVNMGSVNSILGDITKTFEDLDYLKGYVNNILDSGRIVSYGGTKTTYYDAYISKINDIVSRNVNESETVEGVEGVEGVELDESKGTTITVDWLGSDDKEAIDFAKSIKVKVKKIKSKNPNGAEAELTGTSDNLKKFLSSEFYDMDLRDQKETFPELF